MKTCAHCKTEKEKQFFSPSNLIKKSGWCRACCSEYKLFLYLQNKEKIILEGKQYYQDNKESIIIRIKKYSQENEKSLSIYRKEWHQNNKTRLNKNRNLRRKIDPFFRLRQDCSRLINFALSKKDTNKKGQSILNYLSYSFQELKSHIESQFEPWMTWDNQGIYDPNAWDNNDPITWTWQLDHIIPQSDLPYDSMEHPNFKKCWALSNLRPLSAKQNIIEGTNKIRHGKIK